MLKENVNAQLNEYLENFNNLVVNCIFEPLIAMFTIFHVEIYLSFNLYSSEQF